MFLVPGGTDVSPGSDASQASTIMNLLFAASPSLNTGWNTSIIGTTESLIDCGMMNECFVENVATNFMLCFVINFPREAPCKDEFDAAVGAFENGSMANIPKGLLLSIGMQKRVEWRFFPWAFGRFRSGNGSHVSCGWA